MDRRDFLLATGSAVVASAALGNPLTRAPAQSLRASAACPLTLTVAGADNVSWDVGQARELARRIEQASGNSYAVSVADPVNVKAVGLKFLGASQLTEIDRAFAFATGLPGGAALGGGAVDIWLTTAGGQAALDELAATHGLKVLIAAHGGETFLWSAQPLQTAADFAGKYVLATGLGCHVAAGLGAEPWRIVPGTPRDLLASGQVAAIEANVPDAMAQGLFQAARFASTNAFAPHGHAGALTVRLDMWNAMSPAERGAISSAAQENYRESLTANRTCEALNRQAIRQTYAIGVNPVPQGLAASIQTVARAVVAQVASDSPSAAKLNASYMSFMQAQ